MKGLINIGILLALWAAPLATVEASDCDFDCTLERHLNAITSRDFEQFESTLTSRPRLNLILPDGRFTHDSTQYRDMLKGWFETPGWTMTYEVVSKDQTDTMGHALLLVAYDEADRNGSPYHIDHYLSLLFEKEPSGWKLIHDQNTLIQAPEQASP